MYVVKGTLCIYAISSLFYLRNNSVNKPNNFLKTTYKKRNATSKEKLFSNIEFPSWTSFNLKATKLILLQLFFPITCNSQHFTLITFKFEH